MFETMASFVLQEHLAQQSFDPPVGPAGDRRLLSPHNKPVQTADGWISFTINTDPQVRAFLKAVAGMISSTIRASGPLRREPSMLANGLPFAGRP